MISSKKFPFLEKVRSWPSGLRRRTLHWMTASISTGGSCTTSLFSLIAAIISFILQKSHSSRCSLAQDPVGMVVHLRSRSSMFALITSIWSDSSEASCWMVVCNSASVI